MAEAAETASPSLKFRKEGAIGWITADNPARMNALTAAMWEAIPRAIGEAVADPEVRVIILRGAGDTAFSAGADISEFENSRTGDAAKIYDALNDAAFNAITGCPKPTIAMIHGFCLGGGLGLALCCDMRIADDASQFAIPAAKLGLGYNARWVRPILAAVPVSRAKELLFTGRRFRSADAEAMGLVSQLMPKAELEPTVRALAAEIAANAPLSVAAAKQVIDEISRHPENPDMDRLDAAVAACFESEDYAEGRRAFLEKRKPQFKGR
ncbi:enoyl-CoA hydratase [Hyphomicrobium sp.]|uniref:enoyl-CoA hydratase n=1 Tax=Hyphomicrobium sp. TaxID=82 RepID=UPI002D794D2B|nr:enoyl-CoA hydratase [Hyphomicrobium sp.]HET6388185.1 enoyl-CoA hydratase [Hyphomicrobium sp.]